LLSHSPAILRFDPRLTAKFYETIDQPDHPEQFHNIGKVRKEAIYLLLFNSLASAFDNDLPLQRKFANHLLNSFSTFFHFAVSKELNVHSEEFRHKLEQSKSGKILYLKQNLTLEFVLYFIITRKIEFEAKIRDNRLSLSENLNNLYKDLDGYGPDHEFIKFINFKYTNTTGTQYLYDDNPQVDVLNELGPELHSSLIISLMWRLANRGYINFTGMQVEKVSEKAVAFTLPGCKTITLMYVVEDKLRKPLISYLKEKGKKDCSKIIGNFELLSELLNSFPMELRLEILQRSFDEDYVVKIVKNIAELYSFLGLFTYDDQHKIRALFSGKQFVHRDPNFGALFYLPVTGPVNTAAYALAIWLMEARKNILTRALAALIKANDHGPLPEVRDLDKAILNYFAGEAGLIPNPFFDANLLQNKAVKKIVVDFTQLIPKLLSLTNIIGYIFTNNIKPLANDFVKRAIMVNSNNRLTAKLQFFGEDDSFSIVNLFEEEAALNDGTMQPLPDNEIEARLLITLVHRLAISKYIDLSNRIMLKIDDDEIYFFPGNGMNFSSVNEEREPLAHFLVNQTNVKLNAWFRSHPVLADAIDQLPKDRQKDIYRVNCQNLHLFVMSYQKLHTVLEKFSQNDREIFFKHVKTEMLAKVLEDIEHYQFFMNFVPKASFANVINKIPIPQFEKIHYNHKKFICFMRIIPEDYQNLFVERLDADYLQNIHPAPDNYNETFQTLSILTVTALYTQLGDHYFRTLYSNTTRFIMLLRFGNEDKVFKLCKTVSAEHLREIFSSEVAVMSVLNLVPNHKKDLSIHFINLSCPAYQTLFSDQSFLVATLEIMRGNELDFVQRLTANFVPFAQSRDHLFEILTLFLESKARLEFCLKMKTGLIIFIRSNHDFLMLLEFFEEKDCLILLIETFDFLLTRLIKAPEDTIQFFHCLLSNQRKEFYEFLAKTLLFRQLLDVREKFVAFNKLLSFEYQKIFRPYLIIIESFEEAKYERLEYIVNGIWTDLCGAETSYVVSGHKTHSTDLSNLKYKIRLQIDKIELAMEYAIPDKLAQVEQSFKQVLAMLETALTEQFSQSCNRWFSSKSVPQLINNLNKSPFNHHHYTRMLGLILNNLYVSYPDVIDTSNNHDREALKQLVATIKKPMAYRNYLFKMNVESEEEVIEALNEEAKAVMSRVL
jgi:hypothetical protein